MRPLFFLAGTFVLLRPSSCTNPVAPDTPEPGSIEEISKTTTEPYFFSLGPLFSCFLHRSFATRFSGPHHGRNRTVVLERDDPTNSSKLVSGQIWGEGNLKRRPAILDSPVGSGHVVTFNCNPMHGPKSRRSAHALECHPQLASHPRRTLKYGPSSKTSHSPPSLGSSWNGSENCRRECAASPVPKKAEKIWGFSP